MGNKNLSFARHFYMYILFLYVSCFSFVKFNMSYIRLVVETKRESLKNTFESSKVGQTPSYPLLNSKNLEIFFFNTRPFILHFSDQIDFSSLK